MTQSEYVQALRKYMPYIQLVHSFPCIDCSSIAILNTSRSWPRSSNERTWSPGHLFTVLYCSVWVQNSTVQATDKKSGASSHEVGGWSDRESIVGARGPDSEPWMRGGMQRRIIPERVRSQICGAGVLRK
jgi:hypothetical protein